MAEGPRVRFAPSPTGYLHVGGARTALFNWLFARHEAGVFVLRIEDTDRTRSQAELTRGILEGLRWLGLEWDEGPHHQADYGPQHAADAGRLIEAGQAYRCFCTPEELEARRRAAEGADGGWKYDGRCRQLDAAEAERRADAGEPHAVRFRMPPGASVWDDVVHGRMEFDNQEIEDFILLRSDGTPTYQLAVVSDDIAMRITHVIRGADHISNTPKQIQIYRALGSEPPSFAHVPLILGPDGKRLSKRHGATAVDEYRKAGYLPRAMVNFLALLGWSPGDDTEYMEVDELVERFTLAGVNVKSAIFDQEKLEWLNGQHILHTPAAELAELAEPLMIDAGIATREQLDADRDRWYRVLESVRVRARTLADLVYQSRPFFPGELEPEPEAVAKHWKDPEAVIERLDRLRERLADVGDWSEAPLEEALRGLADEMELGAGKLIHPLRVALTGMAVSPGIFEVMALMGRELVLARLDAALDRLRGA